MTQADHFYTVGHSTRTVEELADLLRGVEVNLVVDVRTIPRSRTNPQFNTDTLAGALGAFQIGYQHISQLGGLRGHRKDQEPSRNSYWKNQSFRNYADFTSTADFRAGLAELQSLGRTHLCAIMCAEAVWWRCHRRIIADYLVADGISVFHITGRGKVELASMNPVAVKERDGTLVYPGDH